MTSTSLDTKKNKPAEILDIKPIPSLEKSKKLEDKKEVQKSTITEIVGTQLETMSENITAGKLFEAEAKNNSVMKNFIKKISENTLEVSFGKNASAEHHIGLADLLGEEVKKVHITGTRNGRAYDLIGERQGTRGGFYTEDGKYLPVFEGFKVEILETLSTKDIEARKQQNESKIQAIITSPQVEKFKTKYAPSQMEMIVRKAQDYGIDPTFVLALRNTEDGALGRDFGVMRPDLDTFEGQLTMACRIIQHRLNTYKRVTKKSGAESDGRFTAEFINYFSHVYAPIGASNDPNNLNKNHYSSLLNLYGDYSGKKFEDIPALLAKYEEYTQNWETLYAADEIVGKTNPDDFVKGAEAHLGKPYLLGGDGKDSIDCSQLVIESMKTNGVVDSGFDTTAHVLSRYTIQKAPADVKKGDLVFKKGTDGHITHVEIATGPITNGSIPILHATSQPGKHKVVNDFQPLTNNIVVGTPTFFQS